MFDHNGFKAYVRTLGACLLASRAGVWNMKTEAGFLSLDIFERGAWRRTEECPLPYTAAANTNIRRPLETPKAWMSGGAAAIGRSWGLRGKPSFICN